MDYSTEFLEAMAYYLEGFEDEYLEWLQFQAEEHEWQSFCD